MEVAASAGIVGGHFWRCTIDEILAAHRGRVSEWRVFRQHSYQIVLSQGTIKNPPSIEAMFPLPYDNELSETEDTDWITTLYNQASKEYGWQ